MNNVDLYSKWKFDRNYTIDIEGFLQAKTSEEIADFIALTEEILMLIICQLPLPKGRGL